LNENRFCANCGTGLSGATGQLSPHTILSERYIIVETLGRGGMGAVYKALDQRLGKVPVAVKEMSSSAVKSGDLQAAIESFKKEATILVNLRHHALPRVTDFFSAGEDRWYLVMDYIEGQTLKDLLVRRGPIPENEVLDWARQLCEILDYLHNQKPPIIFRDLKPVNIMLTPDGKIKLIDFGIARNFSPGLTTDTSAYGSPGYSPPEQHGQQQTDARSDIYSLGATLYYLLTGIDPSKRPFFFEPPSKVVSVSTEFESAIMKALEFKPESRPDSVKEMLSLLPLSSEICSEKNGPLPLPVSVPIIDQIPVDLTGPGQSEEKAGEQHPPAGWDETEELKNPWQAETAHIKQDEPEDIPETEAVPNNTYLAETKVVSPEGYSPKDDSNSGRPGWIKTMAAAVGLLLLMAAGAYGYTRQVEKNKTADIGTSQTAAVQTLQQQTQPQTQTQTQQQSQLQPSQQQSQQASAQELHIQQSEGAQRQQEELQRQQEELAAQQVELQKQQDLQYYVNMPNREIIITPGTYGSTLSVYITEKSGIWYRLPKVEVLDNDLVLGEPFVYEFSPFSVDFNVIKPVKNKNYITDPSEMVTTKDIRIIFSDGIAYFPNGITNANPENLFDIGWIYG
jgi:serine/threonine protein kinase